MISSVQSFLGTLLNALRSLVMAFSLFSRIPMPRIEWREENMRYLFCGFPFIGVIIGLLVGLWCWLCHTFGFTNSVQAAGITLIPVAVTGGIHLDGFCDVIDAQASHAEPARKREILKDPHAGAFASIGVGCYLIAYFALATQFVATFAALILLTCAHALNRACSGIASTTFPKNSSNGMLATFQVSAEKRTTVIVVGLLALICAVIMIVCAPITGLVMVVLEGLCLVGLYVFAQRQFHGMSGDLAGFYLQVAEICLLAALVVIL